MPYWDFHAPGIPDAPRDASAAALAASGLLELAGRAGGADGARYRASAERILASLCARYLADPARSAAILRHATGQHPQGAEIDVGIVYADYYLVEALVRYRKLRAGE